MRECSVCGLTFLSGDICPGCGSNVHQQVFSDDAGDVEPDKIPGMESFLETSAGVIPELEEEEEVDIKPSSTLPFGMGGDSVSMKSTLPFGVGSHSLPFSATEHDLPKIEINEVEESVIENTIVEQTLEEEKVTTPPPALELEDVAPIVERNQIPETMSQMAIPSMIDTDDLQEINVAEEIVHHDFAEDSLTTEVEVDLDNLVEYTASEQVFNPAEMEAAAEPELHPIKALAVEGLTDPNLLENVQDGFVAMASENWELAAEKFHKVATSGMGGAAALNNYGLALLQKAIQIFESGDGVQKALVEGQFEAAIFALRQAAQIEGQRSEILYNLAIALHRAAWYDKALVVFDALIERDGPNAAVLNAKAVLLESKGDFESAKNLLNKAIYESPEDEIIRSNLKRLVPI
ncbi:MAG: hypothetical protein CMA03_04805 [Euryarchaeota archaeon]|nr:hypothetical protein [Euryarchaeota archaeon]